MLVMNGERLLLDVVGRGREEKSLGADSAEKTGAKSVGLSLTQATSDWLLLPSLQPYNLIESVKMASVCPDTHCLGIFADSKLIAWRTSWKRGTTSNRSGPEKRATEDQGIQGASRFRERWSIQICPISLLKLMST